MWDGIEFYNIFGFWSNTSVHWPYQNLTFLRHWWIFLVIPVHLVTVKPFPKAFMLIFLVDLSLTIWRILNLHRVSPIKTESEKRGRWLFLNWYEIACRLININVPVKMKQKENFYTGNKILGSILSLEFFLGHLTMLFV